MAIGTPYQEQYDRTKRWYDRFATVNNGRRHDVSSDNYLDEIYAFFHNCYHLKDWIRNDSSVSSSVRGAVEDYINSDRALSLCADICNSLKHLRLTSHRSGENPTFGKKHFALTLGPGLPTTISLKWEVVTNSGPMDAFDLATECLAAWASFFKHHGLS